MIFRFSQKWLTFYIRQSLFYRSFSLHQNMEFLLFSSKLQSATLESLEKLVISCPSFRFCFSFQSEDLPFWVLGLRLFSCFFFPLFSSPSDLLSSITPLSLSSLKQYRAKNDMVNPVAAGFLAGGILARSAGPTAMVGGGVAFAAFSAAIDL